MTDSYSNSLLQWIWKIDRLLLQMLPFGSDAGVHPRPGWMVEHTTHALRWELLFFNSEEFDFTICFHYSVKCTKIDCNWGSTPDPAGGAHRAPQKIIGWISKVFIPSNAPFSFEMHQILWQLGLCPRTYMSSYITLSQKILWMWDICINYIAPKPTISF